MYNFRNTKNLYTIQFIAEIEKTGNIFAQQYKN